MVLEIRAQMPRIGTKKLYYSDRGLQYCANEYQKRLGKNQIVMKTSTTKNSIKNVFDAVYFIFV